MSLIPMTDSDTLQLEKVTDQFKSWGVKMKTDIMLLKTNSKDKAYLCQRLYSLYAKIHAKKNNIAKRRTGGSPWASLSLLCNKMGFQNHIGSRYLIMDLKKRLERSGMMVFNNDIVKGGHQASRFFIVERIKEMAESFADKAMKTPEEKLGVCDDESPDRNSHVYCSRWPRPFGSEAPKQAVAF